MSVSRREFLQSAAAAATAVAVAPAALAAVEPVARPALPAGFKHKLSVAAYSFRNKLNIKSTAADRWTLLDFIRKCADYGADGVELTQYYFQQPITPAYVASLKREAFLQGLTITGTPIGNTFTHPAGEARDAQLKHMRDWIDVSGDIGSPAIRTFAGNTPKGLTEEQARKNVVECLEIVGEHAAKRGVYLALENHGGVVATAEGLLDILKQVKNPWVAVNLDSGNFHSEDPYAELEKIAPYAVTIQFKTEMVFNKKKTPADFGRILKMIRAVNYRGFITLEHEAAEDPVEAVPRHLEAMRKAM